MLSLTEVTAGGIGIIIGAGIYVLIGTATALAGPGVWISFVLAAVLCGLTGLSYAELGARFPSAAAEYTYTQQVFAPWVAFLTGWVMILGLVITAATVALGFARYLTYFVPLADARIGAAALLLAVLGIAWRGIKHSARLTVALSLVQVGGLLFIVAIGLPHIGEQPLLGAAGDAARAEGGTLLGGILGAAALVFFAYIGFDEVATLAEETRDPQRTVPRALLLALGISALLYVAVAIAAVSVLGATALGQSERPLADVAAHVLGQRSAAVMALLALVSTTNTCLLAITSASRVLYGMARDGAFPAPLARVHAGRGAPRTAIVTAVVIAFGFTLIGDLRLIASVADFAVYLVFLAVNGTIVALRRRHIEPPPGVFRVPFAIAGVPLPALAGTLAVLVMIGQLPMAALAIGGGALLLGALAASRLAR